VNAKAAIHHLMQFQLMKALYLIAHIRDILTGNRRINAVQLAQFIERQGGGGQK